MTNSEKARILPLAREMYVTRGLDRTRICEELKIGSRQTLTRWIEECRAAGDDWDKARSAQMGCDPYAPVRSQRKRVEYLIRIQGENLEGCDDRLIKAIQSLDALEKRYGSIARFREVLDQFIDDVVFHLKPDAVTCPHCMATLDFLPILREIVGDFTARLGDGEVKVPA